MKLSILGATALMVGLGFGTPFLFTRSSLATGSQSVVPPVVADATLNLGPNPQLLAGQGQSNSGPSFNSGPQWQRPAWQQQQQLNPPNSSPPRVRGRQPASNLEENNPTWVKVRNQRLQNQQFQNQQLENQNKLLRDRNQQLQELKIRQSNQNQWIRERNQQIQEQQNLIRNQNQWQRNQNQQLRERQEWQQNQWVRNQRWQNNNPNHQNWDDWYRHRRNNNPYWNNWYRRNNAHYPNWDNWYRNQWRQRYEWENRYWQYGPRYYSNRISWFNPYQRNIYNNYLIYRDRNDFWDNSYWLSRNYSRDRSLWSGTGYWYERNYWGSRGYLWNDIVGLMLNAVVQGAVLPSVLPQRVVSYQQWPQVMTVNQLVQTECQPGNLVILLPNQEVLCAQPTNTFAPGTYQLEDSTLRLIPARVDAEN
ncbi:MAG: hypothetical protein WCD18_13040 [Thermosynechococcaceae cyanobacterium]